MPIWEFHRALFQPYASAVTKLFICNEQGLGTLPDGEILAKARTEGRVLLTHDLDFGELLAASGGKLPSVIIFRLKDMRAENVNFHLFSILDKQSDALNKGVVCSVTERKVRIRTLPI